MKVKLITIIIILISFISIMVVIMYYHHNNINNEVVYHYKVDDINTYDYSKLMDEINKQFKPDGGKVYISNCCKYFGANYGNNYTKTSFQIDNIKIIRNNTIYTLNVYNKQNEIYIVETDGNMVKQMDGKTDVEIVKGYPYLLDLLIAYNKIPLNHIKENLSIDEDEFINVRYDDIAFSQLEIKQTSQKERIFIIDQTEEIKEVTENTKIYTNLYVCFYVYKNVPTSNHTYGSSEYMIYFVEK